MTNLLDLHFPMERGYCKGQMSLCPSASAHGQASSWCSVLCCADVRSLLVGWRSDARASGFDAARSEPLSQLTSSDADATTASAAYTGWAKNGTILFIRYNFVKY